MPRDPDLAATAQAVVDTSVRLTRFIRRAVRSSPPTTLSLSALRALAYVAGAPGCSVSEVAEYLLVGVPTGSKLVEELATRGLLERAADPADRRRATLRATAAGSRLLDTAARPAQRRVAVLLAELEPGERACVRDGMELLRGLLEPAEREPAPSSDEEGVDA